jgi:hypothetical protein
VADAVATGEAVRQDDGDVQPERTEEHPVPALPRRLGERAAAGQSGSRASDPRREAAGRSGEVEGMRGHGAEAFET